MIKDKETERWRVSGYDAKIKERQKQRGEKKKNKKVVKKLRRCRDKGC